MAKKLKYILLLLCIAGSIASCKKDIVTDSFDYGAQFKLDTTAIRSYIEANNIPAVKNDYGVFYQIIAPGSGSISYNQYTQITANYTGKLLDGSTFDSTEVSKPAVFALGNVILGWQIGIPLIQKGGKIRLFIPSYYGYGNQSRSKIPANSVLDFTVELLDVY